MNRLYSNFTFIRELDNDYSLYRCIMTHCHIPYYAIVNREGDVIKTRKNSQDSDKALLIKEWEKDIRTQAKGKAADDFEMRRMFQNYNAMVARKYFGNNVREGICIRSGENVHAI